MKWLLFLLLVLQQVAGFAQREATNWHFGNKLAMNFKSGCPVHFTVGDMVTFGGSAVMSDKDSGALLFYTNGRTIRNSMHQPMPNGHYSPLDCANGIGQPALIVPMPGNEDLYYVFHQNFRTYPEGDKLYQICTTVPALAYSMDVLYSVVDMRLNNGLGDVVAMQKDMLLQTKATEKLTAVPHSNGRDYWLVTHEWDSDAFVVHLITPAGISSPFVQRIGSVHRQKPNHDNSEIRGMMKASPDGKKLAVAVNGGARPFDLFDFDAATGILSNYVNLGNLHEQFGVSFSPDNSKLYVSNVDISRMRDGEYYPDNIVQFDLLAGDTEAIITSAQSVIMDNPLFNRPPQGGIGGGFNDMQLAPDGKIYMIGNNWMVLDPSLGNNNVVVLHAPNKKGFDSRPSYSTLTFSGQPIDAGLPNFIQSYFNGLEPVSCPAADECTFSVFDLYPNPATGVVKFNLLACGGKQNFSLHIVNAIGQVVREDLKRLSFEDEVDLSGYAAGLYLFIFTFENRQQVVKKVVKAK
ncbi:T9SS type A sorting domain-containing protein [Pontibacter sp. Tf4]|uniref:T9SS type A sorting domain-containing protein n=1 Tax=Pontibacter sp. Tf4 TaxID=2761620 RepID=UPI001628E9A7|nr:T9SS type A sorting domain-containing protein [Pontibacter sp. Tf4]MBB6611762.1 T9SS type A sorting domain-containing protein [Pontibacter sp. Tf4]